MHFLSQLFSFLFLFLLIFQLWLIGFQTFIDVFGVVEFFCFEIPPKQCCLKFVAKLYFFKLNQRALFIWTFEILESINSSIMFASVLIVPFQSDPQLSCWISRFPFMLELANILNCAWAIIEDNSLMEESGGLFEVELLKSFGFGFEEVLLLSLIHVYVW